MSIPRGALTFSSSLSAISWIINRDCARKTKLPTKKPKKKIGHAGADPGTHVAILRPKSSDTLIEPTTQHHEPTNDRYAIHVLVEEGNQGGRHERFAAHHKT